MLLNCDGTPYQLSGTLQQYDPNNPDINLLSQYNQEVILIGGSPILYYELLIQINNTVDLLYREDRGKIWNPNAVQLFAYYEPVPSQNYLNSFGIDAPDEVQFELSYSAVLKTLGHMPKIGSRLYTPHLGENWVIVQRNLAEFRLWSAFKLLLICQRFQESVTTNEGKVTQRPPDININQGQMFKEVKKDCPSC